MPDKSRGVSFLRAIGTVSYAKTASWKPQAGTLSHCRMRLVSGASEVLKLLPAGCSCIPSWSVRNSVATARHLVAPESEFNRTEEPRRPLRSSSEISLGFAISVNQRQQVRSAIGLK
jgi:hypothetical protein